MRKIILRAHAHHVGTDEAELIEVADDITAKGLDGIALDFGYNVWDSWMPNIGDDDDCDYEDEEQYYQDCGSWWEEYNPDKHDGLI